MFGWDTACKKKKKIKNAKNCKSKILHVLHMRVHIRVKKEVWSTVFIVEVSSGCESELRISFKNQKNPADLRSCQWDQL